MNKFIFYTLPLTLFVACSLQAMEAEKTAKELTTNFSNLSPERPAIITSYIGQPAFEQEERIRKFRDNHTQLFNKLRSVPTFSGSFYQEARHALEENEITTFGGCNHVFLAPDSDLIIRIPSILNKRASYAARTPETLSEFNRLEGELGRTQGTPEFENVKNAWLGLLATMNSSYEKKPVPFYNGISIYENTGRLQEIKKNQNLDKIEIPTASLVAYQDDNAGCSTSDETHFVVQEFVPDMEILDLGKEESVRKLKNLSTETVRQIMVAYTAGYLWTGINRKIGFKPNGSVVFFDLEQPNRRTAEQAFLQDRSNYEIYTMNTVRDLLGTFKNHGTSEQYSTVLDFILNNEQLKKYNQYDVRVEQMVEAGLI